MEATALLEDAMRWLRQHYGNYRFFTERDVVWTVQQRIASEIRRTDTSYRVFNDHTIPPRTRTAARGMSSEKISTRARPMMRSCSTCR